MTVLRLSRNPDESNSSTDFFRLAARVNGGLTRTQRAQKSRRTTSIYKH
jgi:hypothetical protein